LNNRMRNSLCLLLGFFGFKSLPAFAAQDMFLKIDGVEGESQDPACPGCIDVLAWSWGMSNSGTTHIGGVGGEGKVNVQDISLTKWVDKSSPDLMLLTANGKHFPKLELFVRKTCPVDCIAEPYYTLTMEEVLVTSVSTGGSGGEDRLTENVSFNFAKVEWCYTATLKDGNPDTPECYGWDIPADQQQ
jgi:type VI secretion system secreted protein Hcp